MAKTTDDKVDQTAADAAASENQNEKNTGTGAQPNPEDLPMEENKGSKKQLKTYADYVKAKVKPPKEMVSTPKQWIEYLNAFPKARVLAPLGFGEKKGHAFETVRLNGVECTFKKGMFVELPEPMAELIMQHYELSDTNSLETESNKKADAPELN